jgi:aerotaxis receptor
MLHVNSALSRQERSMRKNLPITQREYAFPAGQTLVSVTDLKGRITYCNASFVEVSGFSRDELLGQAHNLVRHPDMPEEAFRDMWATIQSGKPWTGLVKNRRKNGDHYWVQANATPMVDGERITGFLSVRTAPAAGATAQAEQLYARMRDPAGSTLALRAGRVVRLDLIGRIIEALTPGLRGHLFAVQAAAAGAALCAGLFLPPAFGWAVALAAAAGAAVLCWTLAVRPLAALRDAANRLASGDLSATIVTDGKDLAGELQRALMQLSVNLRTVVGDTRREIASVQIAAREIASGNHDLSSRTESQAASLQQTAASMEQINSTVRQSADSAQQGASMARDTAATAERSHTAVRAVVDTMGDIADSAKRMTDIIQVIESVAFQTNILALNAAVEAARAGDAGRGFAVVASEVRSLAGRTTTAAREIRQLIGESADRVEKGTSQSHTASERMREALTAVENVSTVLDQISAGASEQRSGITQINEAVSHMDGITQQNAAMVEQMAAAASSLEKQVEEVNSSMRLFRLSHNDVTIEQANAVALRREARQAAPAQAFKAATPAAKAAPAPRPAAPVNKPAAAPAHDAEWATF